jgi:hypothetical protein
MEAKKNDNYKKTMSNLCQYQIKLQFSLALQMMGVGGAHGSTLTAFLDLPFPMKWGRQFNVLEDSTYEVIQQVKNYSQITSVQEKILEMVNYRDHSVVQNKLEDHLPALSLRDRREPSQYYQYQAI